jgi:6-phosphofructokinase 2
MNGPALPFVTLTLNPAVDSWGEIERLQPMHKLRCEATRKDPGGGGINLARMFARLGASSLSVFPVGGVIGALLESLVSQEGLAHVAVRVAGETRENFTIRDRSSRQEYQFVFPGPHLTGRDLNACFAAALKRLGASSILIASGSTPPGAPEEVYAQLAGKAAALGARFVVDASGNVLLRALAQRPFLVKVSENELGGIVGGKLCGAEDCIAAARKLIDCGARLVAVTRGDKGALLVAADSVYGGTAPVIEPISNVGAGDSFLAALLWDLVRGRPQAEALQTALAAGSAALLSPGTDLCHPSDLERLRPEARVQALPDKTLQPALC